MLTVYRAIIAVNLLLSPIGLRAQTAEDYFHRGAQFYVFGENPKARTEVHVGLQKFPDDPKLLHLAELLKKNEKESPKQQPNPDKQNDDQKQQQPQKQQPKPDSKEQDEQQQARNKQENADNQKQKEQEQAQQKQQQKGQEDEKGDPNPADQAQANAEPAPGQMTVQQAQQLLDSQKGEARAMIFVPAQMLKEQKRAFKDW
jgi:hypothetical protein